MTAHPGLSAKGAVRIERLPLEARFSLRLSRADQAAVGAALALDLPAAVGQIATRAGRRALCLGPDEWQIDMAASEAAAVRAASAAVYASHPHALVEITDREVTFRLSGPRAADLVAIGNPRDPALMPAGTGARTVFDSAQVILIRETEETFTLTVWNSFVPHVSELLEIANTELAVGI